MKKPTTLRRGWTTGACATAAARAAFRALKAGAAPASVTIALPGGLTPTFSIAASGSTWAEVIKDAGDDPDITHGARVRVEVTPGGAGVSFRAGDGVGTVTRPGLPLAIGEPAINPGPRRMIVENLSAENGGDAPNLIVTIAIADGVTLAAKTLNARLGIVGGLSVLGTSGVVIPYSCSAWVAAIQRGVDVARASGLPHIAACTGRTSEAAVRRRYGLEDAALIEMGDFAGALLGYLRRHPVPRLTLGGGFAKLVKLAMGADDLHSARSRLDMARLADWLGESGADAATVTTARDFTSAGQVLELAQARALPLGDLVAQRVRERVRAELSGNVEVEVWAFDRVGGEVGHAG